MKSFSFYKEYYELMSLLNDDEKKELSFAIMQYMFEDIEPALNNRQMAVFNNLKRPLDKQKNKSKNSSKQKQNEIKSKSNQNQIENKIETKSNQNEIKTKSKSNQNEIKTKSNENQNEIKTKSKQNQNEIKTKTHIYGNGNGNVYVNGNDNNSNSFDYCEEQFKRTLSPVEYNLIASWQEWFEDDVINYAIEKTVKNGARALNYTEKIINSWHDKGYKTLNDCKQEEAYKKPKENMPDEWKNVKSKEASVEEIKELEAVLNEFD